MEGKEQSQSRRKQEQGVSMRKGQTGGLKEQCGWPPVSPRNHPAIILSEMGV